MSERMQVDQTPAGPAYSDVGESSFRMTYRATGKNKGASRRTLTAAFLTRRRTGDAFKKYRQSGKLKHVHCAVNPATVAAKRTSAPSPRLLRNHVGYLNGRHERMGCASDLDTAILVAQRGIAASKDDCCEKAFLQNELAVLLLSRHSARQKSADLQKAVQAARDAVTSLPERNWRELPLLFNALAAACERLHLHAGKRWMLDAAIRAAENATLCSTRQDSRQSLWLYNFSVLLKKRFSMKGEVIDLERAISAAESATDCITDRHPLKPALLNSLGASLNSYYELTNDRSYLEKAIQSGHLAVKLAASEAVYLGNLSISLMNRHKLNGDLDDLKEALCNAEAAAQAVLKGHESENDVHHNLAERKADMYRWTGDYKYLESAIELMRQSLNSTPEDHRHYASRHYDLATLLFLRFEKTGVLESLHEAIELSRHSVQATPATHPDQPIYLSNWGNHCASLYDRTKRMSDLDRALKLTEVAAEHVEKLSVFYSPIMGQLGGIWERIYERTGLFSDLEKAIRLTADAVDSCPDETVEKGARLCDLGNLREIRYLRTGAMSDLDDAIAKVKEAIQSTPSSHPHLPGLLNNLAVKLHAHYSRTGLGTTINEAIDHASHAVELTACDHLDWAMYASTLATVLHSRYEKAGQLEDIRKAIKYERAACHMMPKDHELRMGYQHNLGASLSTLYETTSEKAHLSEAISLLTEAVDSAPPGSPLQAGRKHTLATLLEMRCSKPKETNERGEILSISLDVWSCTAEVPFTRIRAGYRALRMLAEELQVAQIGDATSFATRSLSTTLSRAIDLGSAVLDLLPVVHARYLDRKDQQFVISSFSGVASLTAYFCLRAGMVVEAVECLERGRTVIMNQLLSDREELSQLSQTHPALATMYTQLVAELNMNPLPNRQGSGVNTRRYDAAKELDACIAQIRAIPGSGMLHIAQSVSQMRQNIGSRRVVFVNVTEFGSHAIFFSRETLMSTRLEGLTASETRKQFDKNWVQRRREKQKTKNGQLVAALNWLWETCVGPVLQEFLPGPGTIVENLPRVWWIGTGFASSLPFHAAESCDRDLPGKTFDWVVSSYTPSITCLIHAIQRSIQMKSRKERKNRLLLATMPTTPSATRSYADLKVAKEASSVKQSVVTQMKVHELEHPSAEHVLEVLQMCSVAHFACHGEADRRNPSNTALVLRQDGADGEFKQDLLTAQMISDLKLEHAHIAYLSACATAENRAKSLTDEVIHLASGFLVAGFPNVIGSLWGARDDVCAQLATYFYTEIFDDERGGIAQDAAVALHGAIQRLRTAESYPPTNWAQFVHWGV